MIIAAAILLLFLLYKEVKRVNRDRLFLRLLAVVLAVGALICLAFPIKYKVQRNTDPHALRLLSEGADMSLLKDSAYFTTDSSVLLAGGKHIKYIPDLAYYLQTHQDVNRIQVNGYGLQSEELKGLAGITYDFRPAPSPEGVISCSWQQVLKQTTVLSVQGMYNNTSEKPVKLVLEGLGSKLDSVTIMAHRQDRFSLKGQANQLGKMVYGLKVFSGADILHQENIPFQVAPSVKPRLLILSSFPDFEYKFLKNWLYENKYPVVYRTRISKDKFSTDQLNTPVVNAADLNTGMLGKFDLVIADDQELSALSPAAVSSLRTAVSQGLGLLIRMNDVKALSVFAKPYKLYETADSGAKSFTPVLAGEIAAMHAIPGSPSFYIQPQSAEQSLVKDQGGKVLLSSALYGNGKLAVSVIASTYNWKLSGVSSDYTQFWSAVIGTVTRKDESNSNWTVFPAFPVVGEETRVNEETTTANAIPKLTVNQQTLSPVQHLSLPFVWRGTFWPEHTGWNELKIDNHPADYFFVYVHQDWESLKQQERLLENLNYSKKSAAVKENSGIQSEMIEKELSQWWFFAIFLLSAAYIWFETKML